MNVLRALDQRGRQAGYDSLLVVHKWQVILVVIDGPDVLRRVLKEDSRRTEVVRWWVKTDDEASREQILPDHLIDRSLDR